MTYFRTILAGVALGTIIVSAPLAEAQSFLTKTYDTIANLPNRPYPTTPAQERTLKQEAARGFVDYLADQMGNKDGVPSAAEKVHALRMLKNVHELRGSPSIANNPGLEELADMWKTYRVK